MKTKLAIIGLAMVLGGWMAVGNNQNGHPHVRNLEQRVADLEALVVMLSQRLDAQTEQAGTHQAQFERVVPIVNEMELVTWSDGAKTIRMRSADLWVDGGSYSQFNSVVVTEDLYLFGDIRDPFGDIIDY